MSLKGRASRGKLEDLDLSSDEKLDFLFNTLQLLGNSRVGQDVLPSAMFEVVTSVVVEAGSNKSNIKITGHSAKVGDFIRILSSTVPIKELQMGIKSIVDADNFELNGVLSAALQSGDTISLLRPIYNRVSSDGASLASVISPPIQYNEETGSGITAVTVLWDKVTPSNTKALPVTITGLTGDINITAQDINVQLSHTGANPDSTKIGDGTNLWGINASNEGKVVDAAGNALLTTIDADTSILAAGVVAGKYQVDINSIAGIATEVTLALVKTAVETVAGAVAAGQMQVDIVDTGGIALDTTLTTMSGKLPASLGQKAKSASLSVTQSTEDQIRQDVIKTAVATVAGAVAAGQMQVDIVDIAGIATEVTLALLEGKDFATQTTLAAMSAKLPATLGQKASAASLAVVLASDVLVNVDTLNVLAFDFLDTDAENITSASYTEIMADSGGVAGKKIQLTDHSGAFFYLALGAAASEVNKMITPEGGDGVFEIAIPVNSRISLKRVESGTSAAGGISINVLG